LNQAGKQNKTEQKKETHLTERRLVVNPGAPLAMTASSDLVVERTIDPGEDSKRKQRRKSDQTIFLTITVGYDS
jgi:hypothetical protein